MGFRQSLDLQLTSPWVVHCARSRSSSCIAIRNVLHLLNCCVGIALLLVDDLFGHLSICREIGSLEMSDYPPAPQLGTRDHPNYYHHTPSAQAYNTEMSQYRYQSRAQSSYTNAHTQGLSNSINPPPHANAYSFHANAQAPFESGVNGTSAEHNHQAHPHTLSLHPSPHAPTPFDPLYFSQVSVQAPANPNIPPSHIQPLLKQRSHQASVREQSPEQKGLESIVPCESDLEDGEVDDQEIDKSSNLSELNDMGVNFSRSLRQSENEKNNLAVEDSSNGYHSLDKEHSANSVRGNCACGQIC